MSHEEQNIILTREELNNIIDSALKRCSHDKPSKETMEMFNRLNHAIFGEEREKGMLDKTNEMYDVFVVGKSGTTFIKWTGAFLIALGVIISAIKGFSK